MRNKSNFISALMLLVDFLSKLFKEVKRLGGNEETIYKAMNSDKVIAEIAKTIVGVKQTTSRILKHLQLLNPKISISSVSFSRDKFLASKLGVKVYLWDNFKNWIVPELSETIPSFTGDLASYKLTKNMYDSEIRPEIGEDQVFTPDEVVAVIFAIISKQPTGETGNFENTGYANIFYVRLKSGEIVAVDARWDSGGREWDLDSRRLDDSNWGEDNRVFARS